MRSWFLRARLFDRTRRPFGNNPCVFNLSLVQGTPMDPSIFLWKSLSRVNTPVPQDKEEFAEVR